LPRELGRKQEQGGQVLQMAKMMKMVMETHLGSSMILSSLILMKKWKRVISSMGEVKRRRRIKDPIWMLSHNLESERQLWLLSIRYF
jgi:hypothetical protein